MSAEETPEGAGAMAPTDPSVIAKDAALAVEIGAKYGVRPEDVQMVGRHIAQVYAAGLEYASRSLGIPLVGFAPAAPTPVDEKPAAQIIQLPRIVKVQGGHLPERILYATAIEYGIAVADLLSKSRRQPIAQARQVAMYLVRKHAELSLVETGSRCGGRDHTTVIYSCEKIKMLIAVDPELGSRIDRILKAASHEERAPEQEEFKFQ